jgi:hypothetical protein
MTTAIVREISFTPAFHDCAHNRGIGGVGMLWVVRSGDHALEWQAETGWSLSKADFFAADPACTHPMHRRGAPDWPNIDERCTGSLTIHSAVEGNCHLGNTERCRYFDDAPCWYDASFLMADEPWQLLRTGGSDAVWEWLENWLTEYIADRYTEALA